MTYLSKLSDGKSPEGLSTYWVSYVNEFSQYIYAAALGAVIILQLVKHWRNCCILWCYFRCTSYIAYILTTVGGTLSGGVDDYAYTAVKFKQHIIYTQILRTPKLTLFLWVVLWEMSLILFPRQE